MSGGYKHNLRFDFDTCWEFLLSLPLSPQTPREQITLYIALITLLELYVLNDKENHPCIENRRMVGLLNLLKSPLPTSVRILGDKITQSVSHLDRMIALQCSHFHKAIFEECDPALQEFLQRIGWMT